VISLGAIAIERPVTGINRQLLLMHVLRHIDAMRDALAVSDDERRAVVRFAFDESLDRVRVVGAMETSEGPPSPSDSLFRFSTLGVDSSPSIDVLVAPEVNHESHRFRRS